MKNTEKITDDLIHLQDLKYRDFQSRLIPGVDPGSFIGVRTPDLRKMARAMYGTEECRIFLSTLPHRYFDENQLHAFMLDLNTDFIDCVEKTNIFLPYVDNWATCDQFSPKIFRKHRKELLQFIRIWISSDRTFTLRFGIKMLMSHFLDDEFDPAYLRMVSEIRSGEYYVKMMIAWYFATALAKQYETAFPFIKEGILDPWTHNRTIQKSLESFRISQEKKTELKTFRR